MVKVKNGTIYAKISTIKVINSTRQEDNNSRMISKFTMQGNDKIRQEKTFTKKTSIL